MIFVRCLGHIGTTAGKEIAIAEPGLDASEIIERVRALSGKQNPGFDRYNTLLMVEDGEAFVPASASARVADGARVVLIPFSHGG